MEPARGRIPAWQRLGLKLTNDDQSGHTVTNSNGTRNLQENIDETPRTSGSDDGRLVGHVECSRNGKPSRLGKRQHDDSPAEGDGRAFKKSRKLADQVHLGGSAGDVAAASSKGGNGGSDVKSGTASTTDGPKPKGDPNYRKKKGKQIRTAARESPDRDGTQKITTKQSGTFPDTHDGSRKQFPDQSPSPTEPHNTEHGTTLLPSTETDFAHSPPATPPELAKSFAPKLNGVLPSALSSSPTRPDRRKSVTFTPDTKTADGNSASALFKQWVADQKGLSADFTPAEVAQFTPPPKVHPANGLPASHELSNQTTKLAKKDKKTKKKGKSALVSDISNEPSPAVQSELGNTSTNSADPVPNGDITKSEHSFEDTRQPTLKPKGKKKDSSIYLSYLDQYHNDRAYWKFNKAKQNDVLDNALNIFRIPNDYSDALLEYIKGLKGAGVVERLRERCQSTLKELDEASEKDPMNDQEARKIAKEEALQEHLAKQKKRRRTDGDIDALANHPNPDGYIRRLKRHRAEALLEALSLASPISQSSASVTRTVNASTTNSIRKPARNRKSRTQISSDEDSDSSSVSSSSEDPSSESNSDDSSDDENESAAEGGSESESGEGDKGSSDEGDDSSEDEDESAEISDSIESSDDDEGSSGENSNSDDEE